MTRFLPVANPPNRFEKAIREYDLEETPGAPLLVYEDHSRTIVSRNDSPDVGFDFSVNPYRGCYHACRYCVDGDTQILMGDATTRAIRDVRVGDSIYGTYFDGKYRRYTKTLVHAHWRTVKRAYRVSLNDGTELIASADHRFLTQRGWKYVAGSSHQAQRPHLTTGNRLIGVGGFAKPPRVNDAYKRGYLCGFVRGDGMLFRRTYEKDGRKNETSQFRLALIDLEPLRRARAYLRELAGVATSDEYVFQEATATTKRMVGIRTGSRGSFDAVTNVIAWPDERDLDWSTGFLAGIFDAEGSMSQDHTLRISNTDERIIEEICLAAAALGFNFVVEQPASPTKAKMVRIRGGLREHLRFFHSTAPTIARKWSLQDTAIKGSKKLWVMSVQDLGFDMLMYDITTGTEDFIANGVVSHNCYARPSHEYLSFGAGSDFERKIVVKPNAPELLREAFDKKSWKGDLVMFSGITDCYQPLEHEKKLTRGCLEVCLEYKNPLGIITKSPIIERDIDLLVELVKHTSRCRVSISIPFWNPDYAKAMEPFVTTPARRMKIIETLAKAGVPVGISVSPIVPGLNDEDIGEVLERAADAGASHAFFVLLRLPGAVKDVFEKSLREKLPLRAEKVFRRLREAHDGKLYDSAFGKRGRGDSVYAKTIDALFTRTAVKLGLKEPGATSNSYEEMLSGAGPEPPTSFVRPNRSPQTSFGF